MVQPAELRLQGTRDESVAASGLGAATEPFSLTEELRHYLQAEVIRQRCTARRVARLRKITRRTLSRRLRAEGMTFKQLADEAQFRVARKLLADPCMSIAEVSTALNFSQPSGFTHAFRRWSGVSPSAWRQANQPGSP